MSKWRHNSNLGTQAMFYGRRRYAQIQSYINKVVQLAGNRLKARSLWSLVLLFVMGISFSAALASCRSDATSAPQREATLNLVSFSVTEAAYQQIIPKFVQKWQQEHNQKVTFNQSYGASNSQARAVIDGTLPADIVHLSIALDTNQIVQAGLIQPGWEKEEPRGGIVTRSVVALVTRAGNPGGITSWEDLAQEGIHVITPNPKTSGSARWNFLGLWGSVTQTGGDEEKAQEFVSKIYKNVSVLPESAREASDLFFKQNQGDVLISYENEVILSQQNGEQLTYTVPDVNISIDNPVTVVDKNVDKHGNKEIAKAFVDFLYSSEAQKEFAKLGYRSVNPFVKEEVAQNYPQIKTLFNVQDLGGWDTVQSKFFVDGGAFDRIQSANKA